MTTHLPESGYLAGEREAELADAQVGDGRELWSPVDNNLLYTAEDLGYMHEYEGEAEAELGASYFYGDGPECRDSSVALNVAREYLYNQFRRTHNGFSKEGIERRYADLYGRA